MHVVVIGGGFGGMATAARLATIGHSVTVIERADALGGALSSVSLHITDVGNFTWDAGASSTLLPAVIRDLFRTSGPPLEHSVDLQPLTPIRAHRFSDGTWLRLPGGSRTAQLEELGPRGTAWVDYVASYADTWELLRRDFLERTWDPRLSTKELRALFSSRETLHRRLKRQLPDPRLRDVAAYPSLAAGHDLRNVPAWTGVTAYVEQRFGAWTVPGGMATLGRALADRLSERAVQVVTSLTARDIVVREGRAVAVATDQGDLDADVVVCAVDPRRLPALADHVVHTMPALPPTIAHLALVEVDPERGTMLPSLAQETVWHGDPWFTVHTGGQAPEGHAAWTIHGRGKLAEDPVLGLARLGLKVNRHVIGRIDASPRRLVERWGGSPYGVVWQGRGTVTKRLGPRTPISGVYAAGAHASPGAGIPYAGLSAALVAHEIGPAGHRPRAGA